MSKSSYSKLFAHLVWATKYRNPCFDQRRLVKTCKFIREHIQMDQVRILSVNGWTDHLHCLVNYSPKHALSKIVKNIKGPSSKWINDQELFRHHFEWQIGYSAHSVSPYEVEKINNYIKNQWEHHYKKTGIEIWEELPT